MSELFDKHFERCVLVVSHSGLCRGCFAVVGHRYYRPRNVEFIPLLLTDATEEVLHRTDRADIGISAWSDIIPK
ncbi:hypothetical protein CCR75_006535 [Bremia lactucae]|uniref:Phosphoglycerate mutase n=1 Tax=Bremia lactucae TaxID=4779 RepID=A0A976IBW9_BRELC|nr:hypothetical protein CCR75_006535 [Bremia lactucae]